MRRASDWSAGAGTLLTVMCGGTGAVGLSLVDVRSRGFRV